jgi:pyruvate formate lyase activating enzyme
MQCVKACRFDGLVRWGNIVTADEVIAEVEKEKPFYKHSGGGMTLTGGEPMAQPEFASALMEKAKALAIGTALDTCGYAPWEDFERVLKFTDLVLLDIKMMDSKAHRDFTGAGNELIHENARRMAEMGLKIRIRVPIIPGKNDPAENMKKTAVFAESLNNSVVGVDLLPYHPFVGGKYAAFGMEYQFPAVEEYDDERLESVVDLFLEHVCEVTIGG